MLYVFIKHGFVRQFGLARTVNHLAPLLVALCWGKWVLLPLLLCILLYSFVPPLSPCQFQIVGAVL